MLRKSPALSFITRLQTLYGLSAAAATELEVSAMAGVSCLFLQHKERRESSSLLTPRFVVFSSNLAVYGRLDPPGGFTVFQAE